MRIIETRAAPNPRRVRIFLAEKGLVVPFEQVDMMAGELKSPEFTALNRWQRVPVLQFDDGRVIAESVAICRYFEEIEPEPPLFGRDAVERASVEMWQRRIELGLFNRIAQVIRHLNPKMAHLEVPQIAAWGEANRPKALEDLAMLDDHLASSRFVVGEHYSIADITLLVAIDFLKPAKLALPEGAQNLKRWYTETSARPSAAA
jgi:glutathione S-transferase